jgi:exopolysaccharide biosynthesis protein
MYTRGMKTLLASILLLLVGHSTASGISYDYFSEGYFTSIHVLMVNPREHTIVPVKATPKETVATLAESHGAVAAINGGFYKPDGTPAGALKIDNIWYGAPKKSRGAIGWSEGYDDVIIDKILTNYPLDECPEGESIEVIPTFTPAEQWQNLKHIVAGTPLLITQGNLIEDYSSEHTREDFLTNRFPRTAVGIKESGEWVFVVVDGSFSGALGGMTMRELGQLMIDLGCVEALNLCGGGSSTMIFEGKVINEPAGKTLENDKYVNAVGDAILIFPVHQ